MKILVTNDDGVTAPGLLVLAQSMRDYGEVTVLAPNRNWSGGGHVKTIDRPLRVREVTLEDGSAAFTSDGAPSDCVALAMLGFFENKFDLVVSGINPMANLGHDVTYSGTVTAAMESVIWGVPAIAFSLDRKMNHLSSIDYSAASQAAKWVLNKYLRHPTPDGVFLNVNVPFLPEDQIKGYRVTRQGLRVYRDRLDRRVDPRGLPYYWIGGDSPSGIPEDDTDIGALSSGFVSITPLHLDMTVYPIEHVLSGWSTQLEEA